MAAVVEIWLESKQIISSVHVTAEASRALTIAEERTELLDSLFIYFFGITILICIIQVKCSLYVGQGSIWEKKNRLPCSRPVCRQGRSS